MSKFDITKAVNEMCQPRPGWHGGFTTMEALGAYRNGTRVVKAKSEPGDAHPDGSLGTVLGSLIHPEQGVAYFIEWDARPKHAVLVIAWKIAGVA